MKLKALFVKAIDCNIWKVKKNTMDKYINFYYLKIPATEL